MFWSEQEKEGKEVCTQRDLETFTHVIYLNTLTMNLSQFRQNDTQRDRPSCSIGHLGKWQQTEKKQLRKLCYEHNMLFWASSPDPENENKVPSANSAFVNKVITLLHDFRQHTEEYNLSCAQKKLDELLGGCQSKLETMLIMDADKTLATEDTGTLFWDMVTSNNPFPYDGSPLEQLFSSALGYSYTAFRQATLLYEEKVDDQGFDNLCEEVASEVAVHPDLVSLLQVVAEQEHIGAMIITSGLRHVWNKVLEKIGLSKTVKVIGGGRIADGFVVSPTVKGALVSRLRDANNLYVWAFGDSPIDLDMLKKANQAIVVVGEQQHRSTKMDAALLSAIDNDGLVARQVLLPGNASPRLDTKKLPPIHLTGKEFVDSVLSRRNQHAAVQINHASDRAATKLLMTPMRNAQVTGPSLRKAHHDTGKYLATEILTDVIGLQEYRILHVQGYYVNGYRLLHEQQTLIVALMRGGEPMAFGVNEAFPFAKFLHANCPNDIKLHHLQGRLTVMLVDSVVNSGKTIAQFVQHIRDLHATIRIVVVASVVQDQAISSGGSIQALAYHGNLHLVALRISENSFVGKGITDTGNRLFNTTDLP